MKVASRCRAIKICTGERNMVNAGQSSRTLGHIQSVLVINMINIQALRNKHLLVGSWIGFTFASTSTDMSLTGLMQRFDMFWIQQTFFPPTSLTSGNGGPERRVEVIRMLGQFARIIV